MIGKRVLRKREVLERLGIRKTTLYESFIKTGRLRFVKIGARAVGVIEDKARCPDRGAAPRARSERLKVPQVDHETDVEKWFIDRHRSKKSVPEATVVGSFT